MSIINSRNDDHELFVQMNKHKDIANTCISNIVNTNEKMTQKKIKTKFGFSNFPIDESKTKSWIDIDKQSGELFQHYEEYDYKGSMVNSGCYSLFWNSNDGKSVSADDEQQLRKLGMQLSQKLGKVTPDVKFNFWKSILEKKALNPESNNRVIFRYVMLGAGFTVAEIKQLERMVDKN